MAFSEYDKAFLSGGRQTYIPEIHRQLLLPIYRSFPGLLILLITLFSDRYYLAQKPWCVHDDRLSLMFSLQWFLSVFKGTLRLCAWMCSFNHFSCNSESQCQMLIFNNRLMMQLCGFANDVDALRSLTAFHSL